MSRLAVSLSFLAMLGFTLALSGCKDQSESSPSQPVQDDQESSAGEHEGHSEHEEALSQLSDADRKLAEKQGTCPVSGKALGSMGTPYKVTVKGQEVLLCCPGCESSIKENPDEYLAKLNE